MLGYPHARTHIHEGVISHVRITCSVCVNVACVCGLCVYIYVHIAYCLCVSQLCLQVFGCMFPGGVVSVPECVFCFCECVCVREYTQGILDICLCIYGWGNVAHKPAELLIGSFPLVWVAMGRE